MRRGAYPPLGPVSNHRPTDFFARHHAHSRFHQLVARGNQNDERVGIRFSKTPHPRKIGRLSYSNLFVHPSAWWLVPFAVPALACGDLPADPLDVVVHAHGQLAAASGAAAFQHVPPF
jgi:hypothetical protein